MLKAVNLLKVFSIVLFLVILSLVYAYLPIMVKLRPLESGFLLHKETFFYYAVAIFVIVNVTMLGFQKLFEQRISGVTTRAWVRGFTFVINLYFTFLLGFIGVINNTAHLNPSGFAYLNYLGPVLVFSWLIGLIYLVSKKH